MASPLVEALARTSGPVSRTVSRPSLFARLFDPSFLADAEGLDRLARVPGHFAFQMLPQIAGSAVDAAALPGDVYAGRIDPLSNEGIGRATDLAGLVTLGSGAMPAKPNTLRAGAGIAKAATDAMPATNFKAFHGSPFDFDTFSLDKVGVIGGGPDYGVGVNLSGNPKIADAYRKAFSPKGGGYLYEVAVNKPRETFLDFSKRMARQSPIVRKQISAIVEENPPGYVYREATGKYAGKYIARRNWTNGYNMRGRIIGIADTEEEARGILIKHFTEDAMPSELYQAIGGDWIPGMFGSGDATKRLSGAGIPGIAYVQKKYGGRIADWAVPIWREMGWPEGENFVVFDPSAISIINKIPAPAAAFDPAKKTSPDLLALGGPGGAVPGVAMTRPDDRE